MHRLFFVLNQWTLNNIRLNLALWGAYLLLGLEAQFAAVHRFDICGGLIPMVAEPTFVDEAKLVAKRQLVDGF